MEPGDNGVEKGRVLKAVRRNFEGWTKREVKEAKLPRTLQSRVDRLKHDFAWENDEYDVPKETPIHPEISAEFPGVLMDGDNEEHDLGLDDHDETDEELAQRVSQTTWCRTSRSAGRACTRIHLIDIEKGIRTRFSNKKRKKIFLTN